MVFPNCLVLGFGALLTCVFHGPFRCFAPFLVEFVVRKLVLGPRRGFLVTL
jgi:hypothetical protein